MRAVLVLAMVLPVSAASAWAAPLPSAGNVHNPTPSLGLPDADTAPNQSSPGLSFRESQANVESRGPISRAPILAPPPSALQYRPDAYTLTHFDPTNLQVFGGTVGGNGVKDGTGAVVSLTWPIER